MAEKNMMEETEEEEKEASKPGDRGTDSEPKKDEPEGKKKGGRVHHRKHGGHLPLDGAKEHKAKLPHHGRKSGGKVPGHKSEARPDRRARGGATSDLHPETAAGKMSVPAYEAKQARPAHAGKGTDNRGPKSMQG